MPQGHDLKTSSSARSTPLIDVFDRTKPSDHAGARFDRSTDFIVTPEDMDGPGSKDPAQARLEIVQKLHSTCASRVYGFLRKSVAPDIADDLTQETFLKLLQVKNLERKSISISYLFRIAQNLLRRRFNVTKRRREIREKMARFETSAHQTGSSEPVVIEASMLDAALEILTDHEQATIRLIICDGLSYTQAARVLNVPVSTINNWKHRALHKLKGTIDAADFHEKTPTDHSVHLSTDLEGSRRKQASSSPEAPGIHDEASKESGSRTGRTSIRFAG